MEKYHQNMSRSFYLVVKKNRQCIIIAVENASLNKPIINVKSKGHEKTLQDRKFACPVKFMVQKVHFVKNMNSVEQIQLLHTEI
jgi:hypothetical protein